MVSFIEQAKERLKINRHYYEENKKSVESLDTVGCHPSSPYRTEIGYPVSLNALGVYAGHLNCAFGYPTILGPEAIFKDEDR